MPPQETRASALRELERTVLRGVVHELANAAQMLAMPSPGEAAVAEARQRLDLALGVLTRLTHRDAAPGPGVVAEAVAEALQWQALQSAWPHASVEAEVAAGLPAVSMPTEAVRDLALAMVTAAKRAGARHIRVIAGASARGCRLTCEHDGAAPARAEWAALATETPATVAEDGSLWLPATGCA